MKYEELAPSQEFVGLIERFWEFELEAQDPDCVLHVVIPDGSCTLAVVEFNSDRPMHVSLSGPSEVALRLDVRKGIRYRGLRLCPGALRAFFDVEVQDIIGKCVALLDYSPALYQSIFQHLNGKHSLTAFAKSLEKLFAERCNYAHLLDSMVCGLAQQLIQNHGNVSISKLMKAYPISERQLRRRFFSEVGLTPKTFSRLRRVRRACVELAQEAQLPKITISYDHGYADQSHFTREIQTVFSMSPQLLHQYLRQIQHTHVAELSQTKSKARIC